MAGLHLLIGGCLFPDFTHLRECLTGLGENSLLAGQLLPAADNDIHEARFDLDAAAGAACLFRCDQGRAAAEEDIRTVSPRWLTSRMASTHNSTGLGVA